jgi:PAS domain S-box-containing protein
MPRILNPTPKIPSREPGTELDRGAGQSRQGSWKLDKDLRFRRISRTTSEMLGRAAKAILGKTLPELPNLEPVSRSWEDHQAVWTARQAFCDAEFRCTRGDGSVRYICLSGDPILDAKRVFRGYQGKARDVTERMLAGKGNHRLTAELEKHIAERTAELASANATLQKEIRERLQLEAVLAAERNLLRTLVDAVPDYMFAKDAQSRFVLANAAVAQVMGAATPADLLGKTDFDFYPREMAEHFFADEQALVQSGEPLIGREEIVTNVRTGEAQAHLTTKVPLRDGQGKVTGLVGVGRNIDALKQTERELRRYKDHLEEEVARRAFELQQTNQQLRREMDERKQAEEARGEAEQKYRSMVEEAVIGICQTSPDGRYLSVNPAMARMFGYDSPEELMTNITNISEQVYVDPKLREEFMLLLEQHGALKNFECQVYRKDGSKMWVSSNIRANRRGGVIVSYDGMSEDITERKALEEQLRQSQKMEAVGNLSGGIAHDFNNLLTIIKGYSRQVLEREQNPELRTQVERIDQAAERAASLTRQLLAFSRRQLLQPKVFNLTTLVLNLEKMFRRLIGEDIDMVTVAAPDLDPVKADPGQIEQVIMNLVVNARDAMPHGGKLTLETAHVDLDEAYALEHVGVSAGRYVMLAVSDTGVGMDSEIRSHIFEPFFTTKDPGRGTGLGLSMVYGIVKQSGGNISVYSELGRGTTVKVYLPPVNVPAEVLAAEPVATPVAGGRETILLVEDDPHVRELTRDVLSSRGYAVLVVEDTRTVASVCEQYAGPIHLLLTDVVMPGLSGREVVSRVLAQRPETKILYMSGYTTDAVVHHGVLDANAFFLPKPFTPRSLAAKVREVLDHTAAAKPSALDR